MYQIKEGNKRRRPEEISPGKASDMCSYTLDMKLSEQHAPSRWQDNPLLFAMPGKSIEPASPLPSPPETHHQCGFTEQEENLLSGLSRDLVSIHCEVHEQLHLEPPFTGLLHNTTCPRYDVVEPRPVDITELNEIDEDVRFVDSYFMEQDSLVTLDMDIGIVKALCGGSDHGDNTPVSEGDEEEKEENGKGGACGTPVGFVDWIQFKVQTKRKGETRTSNIVEEEEDGEPEVNKNSMKGDRPRVPQELVLHIPGEFATLETMNSIQPPPETRKMRKGERFEMTRLLISLKNSLKERNLWELYYTKCALPHPQREVYGSENAASIEIRDLINRRKLEHFYKYRAMWIDMETKRMKMMLDGCNLEEIMIKREYDCKYGYVKQKRIKPRLHHRV